MNPNFKKNYPLISLVEKNLVKLNKKLFEWSLGKAEIN